MNIFISKISIKSVNASGGLAPQTPHWGRDAVPKPLRKCLQVGRKNLIISVVVQFFPSKLQHIQNYPYKILSHIFGKFKKLLILILKLLILIL